MKTEKATSRYDLPHPVESAEHGCVCGRHVDDQLHDPSPTIEQAAHQQPLQTEKGS